MKTLYTKVCHSTLLVYRDESCLVYKVILTSHIMGLGMLCCATLCFFISSVLQCCAILYCTVLFLAIYPAGYQSSIPRTFLPTQADSTYMYTMSIKSIKNIYGQRNVLRCAKIFSKGNHLLASVFVYLFTQTSRSQCRTK